MEPFQSRLVIERIDLAQPAAETNVNGPLCPRRMMRLRHYARRVGQQSIPTEQSSQRRAAQTMCSPGEKATTV